MNLSHLKQIFQHLFPKAKRISLDPYSDYANASNHSWILREHEIQEQLPLIKYRTNENFQLRLGDILSHLYDIHTEEVSDMHILFGSEHLHIDDIASIWNYNLLYEYIKNRADNKFPSIHAFITLLYRDKRKQSGFSDKSSLHTDGSIMIHCYPISHYKSQTSYLQISICIPEFPANSYHTLNFNETNVPYKVFTIAYDFVTPSQAKAEYNYIKESIVNSSEPGYSTLTANEWTLLEHIHPDIGSEFYWGKKAFNDYRYMDAILYFKNVYNNLRDCWYKKGLSSKEMSLLTECSYLIGYAYNDLKLYDKAYQYLELAGRSNNKSYKYKQEFVNCLVNSQNLLSIIYIDDFLQDLKNLPDTKRSEEDLHFFYFLLRRKAYLLIEMEQLDDAEYILYQLLQKDPDNIIVLKELAYIQHKRKQKNRASQESASKK